MKANMDFVRHIGAGVGAAVAVAAVGYLGHVDWSTLGPYAVFAQAAVQVATELVNKYLKPAAE